MASEVESVKVSRSVIDCSCRERQLNGSLSEKVVVVGGCGRIVVTPSTANLDQATSQRCEEGAMHQCS